MKPGIFLNLLLSFLVLTLASGCGTNKDTGTKNGKTVKTAPPYDKFIVFNKTKDTLTLQTTDTDSTKVKIPGGRVIGIKKEKVKKCQLIDSKGHSHDINKNKCKIPVSYSKDSATVVFLVPESGPIGEAWDNYTDSRPGAGGYTTSIFARYAPGIEINSPGMENINSFAVYNNTGTNVTGTDVNPNGGVSINAEAVMNNARPTGSYTLVGVNDCYLVSLGQNDIVSYVIVKGIDNTGKLITNEIRNSGMQIPYLEDSNPAWATYYLSTDNAGFPAVILVIYR